MSNKPKYFCFCDADLDGCGSYLTLTWLLNQKIPFLVTPSNRFREEFLEWQKHNNINEYEKIFILDLDTSSSVDIIDRKNFVIVDHHESHLPFKEAYKEATTIIEVAPSTCKLVYKKLNVLAINLTKEQKFLILLVDDYDSYQFKLKETRCLNTLFWNYQGNKVDKFYDRFKDGFLTFDMTEENIYTFYQKRLERIKSELQIFTANININNTIYKFVSTFANEFINDIAEYVLEKTKSEVCLVINLKTNKVSFRRSKDSTFDVNKLAAKLGKGGGHPWSSGSALTPEIQIFSKLFSAI